jgi:hypothetical protein
MTVAAGPAINWNVNPDRTLRQPQRKSSLEWKYELFKTGNNHFYNTSLPWLAFNSKTAI